MEKYYDILRKYLKEDRFKHCIRTAKMAEKLCDKYMIDKRAVIAALLHDIAKELSLEEMISILKDEYSNEIKGMYNKNILHGYVGAIICKNELNITDPLILNAIAFHTTGKENMNDIEKVVYIADAIEDGRCYDGVEKIREKVLHKLNEGILFEINHKINYLITENIKIHVNTILFRNSLLEEIK